MRIERVADQKRAEMLPYELAGRGCCGMWVGTEPDYATAQAAYRKAGAKETTPFLPLSWI
jgi:hypothetical protein